MPLTKCNILLALLFMGPIALTAQKRIHSGKLMNQRNNHSYNAIKISRAKAKTVCPIFEDTGYPYHGIGLKLGDPFALSYKYYANKHFSFGVDFGKSASGLYSSYYRELFDGYTDPDTLEMDQSVEYLTHKVNSDWVAEVRVLYHMKAEKISPGLQAYIGLGWEVRSLEITYDYFVNDGIIENQIESISRSRFTYGVEATIGIEYSYFTLPISAFMELEMFNDLLRDPGYRKIQGGVGLRYIF